VETVKSDLVDKYGGKDYAGVVPACPPYLLKCLN
jgi:hypothetical protein